MTIDRSDENVTAPLTEQTRRELVAALHQNWQREAQTMLREVRREEEAHGRVIRDIVGPIGPQGMLDVILPLSRRLSASWRTLPLARRKRR